MLITESKNLTNYLLEFQGKEGEVLDYIQLFNSVEVLAPGIEMDNLNRANHFHNTGKEQLSVIIHILFDLFQHL